MVHTSNAELTKRQKEILKENAIEIQSNHAKTDIEVTLNHFDKNKLTLKDISTLIAIAIKTIRCIDKQLQIKYSSVKEIIDEIKNINKFEQFKSACKNGNKTILKKNKGNLTLTRRKLNHFIELHLQGISQDLKNELIDNYENYL